MLKALRRRLRLGEDGTVVEGVFVVPLLAWALTAMVTYTRAFEARNELQKASFTIADVLSREQGTRVNGVNVEATVNPSYVNSLYSLLVYLSKSGTPVDMRITQIMPNPVKTDPTKPYAVVWSSAKGSFTSHTNTTINAAATVQRIPRMSSGEYLLIIETRRTYKGSSLFTDMPNLMMAILPQVTFAEFIALRPRFEPRLMWSNS